MQTRSWDIEVIAHAHEDRALLGQSRSVMNSMYSYPTVRATTH